ncbi:retropepsin-like aspartic protease, partial [Bacteroidota bacterium]
AFLFSSCSIIKTISIIKSGEIVEEAYLFEIPFEVVHGEIIITVKIQGKYYRFAFDTGAMNVLSKKISDDLGIEAITEVKSSDAHQNENDISLSKIDNISIGELDYKDQGFAIFDFDELQEIKCFDIHGIIGANLMRNSIWQIDLQNKKMLVASHIDSLNIRNADIIIPFTQQITGTPEIQINISNLVFDNVIFDYGSNSGINLFSSNNQIDSLEINHKVIKSYGSSSIGLYGGKSDTISSIRLNTIKMGDKTIDEQIITLNNRGTSTIGTEVFKNIL